MEPLKYYWNIIKYFEKVRECCAFNSVLDSGFYNHNIDHQMVCLQESLPDGCKIYTDETPRVREIYLLYRSWLLERFFDQFDSFVEGVFPKFYSKHYKRWSGYDVPELKDRYGEHNVLFFAATLNAFLSEYLDISYLGIPRSKTDNADVTPYKMLLATQEILRLTGRSSDDYYIEAEKKFIVGQ